MEYSDDITAILSTVPKWIVRRGMFLIFTIFSCLLTLSWFVKYPDELVANAVIYANQPPVQFQNLIYGKLEQLNVYDGQWVKKGQVIAQFDHKINLSSLKKIERVIQQLKTIGENPFPISNELKKIDLAQNNHQFQTIISLIDEWNELLTNNLHNKRMQQLQLEFLQKSKLLKMAKDKVVLFEKDCRLNMEQLISAKKMYAAGVISKDEYFQVEKNENQSQHALQSQKETILQQEILFSELKKKIFETNFANKDHKIKLLNQIKQSAVGLEISLESWRKSAVWISPCFGQIHFQTQLFVNSYYKPDAASLMLVPKGRLYNTILKLPINGAGLVKKNQHVLIEIADYNKNDFGLVKGTVETIASAVKDNYYEVKVKLPNKLMTTSNKIIPIKTTLQGSAKIITQEKRLLERLFENLLDKIQR